MSLCPCVTAVGLNLSLLNVSVCCFIFFLLWSEPRSFFILFHVVIRTFPEAWAMKQDEHIQDLSLSLGLTQRDILDKLHYNTGYQLSEWMQGFPVLISVTQHPQCEPVLCLICLGHGYVFIQSYRIFQCITHCFFSVWLGVWLILWSDLILKLFHIQYFHTDNWLWAL